MTFPAIPALSPATLVLFTAIGYVIATVGLKVISVGFVTPGIVATVLGFVLACAAEVVLMRQTHLSVVYIAILGVETVIMLAIAFSIGEGFTLRQGLGAVLVLTGLSVLLA